MQDLPTPESPMISNLRNSSIIFILLIQTEKLRVRVVEKKGRKWVGVGGWLI